jgi:hypothetical protein
VRWDPIVRAVAGAFILHRLAFCILAAAMSVVAVVGAVTAYEYLDGWARLYFFGGAATVAYLLVQLTPSAIHGARRASATYPDRMSKLFAILDGLAGPIFFAGFLALPTLLLWPGGLSAFLLRRRRQRARELQALEDADQDQIDEFLSASRTSAPSEGRLTP